MRIAYVTDYDSWDVGNWSGLGHYIAGALERQGIELVRIGPLRTLLDPLLLAQYGWARLRGRKFLRRRDPRVLRSYARQVEARLREEQVDLVFSPGTPVLSYLETPLPRVFWTDAVFAAMVGFYAELTGLCAATLRDGNRAEQLALSRSALAIYASDWAAEAACIHYRVDPAKLAVVPFGANLPAAPGAEEIAAWTEKKESGPLRLLFAGVDWRRKGGDLALALAETLNRKGVRAELIVVGCRPPGPLPDFVSVRGFLSKAKPEEAAELERLFSQAHFLLLPSRAECAGLVVAEANACGVPALVSDVGGLRTQVRQGGSGYAFPLGSFVEEAVPIVLSLAADRAAYRRLAEEAHREYRERLNWETAGRRVRVLLDGVLAAPR